MKKFMKALATILAVATFATIPAMAENALATENAAVEAQESTAVEALFGTDIEESAQLLGLKKTQTQGEGEYDAYLTLYENDGIMLGARDGKIVDITIFDDNYDIYGVKIGMTADEAKNTLETYGIHYYEDEIMEIGIRTLNFKMPGNDNAECSFDLDEDNKIMDAHIGTANDAAEDYAEDKAEDYAESAEDTTEDMVEDAVEEAEDKAEDEAEDKAEDYAEGAEDTTEDMVEDAVEEAEDKAEDEAEDMAEDEAGEDTEDMDEYVPEDDLDAMLEDALDNMTDDELEEALEDMDEAARAAETERTDRSKATAPVKATGYIKLTGEAHLRKAADKESNSLKILTKGTKLKYFATAKDARGVTWYKVKTNGKTGWVSSRMSKKIKKSEYNSTRTTHERYANGYIELIRKGNMRKSPNKDSKKLDAFITGTILEYTAVAKDSRGVTWYKVTAGGHTGWISAKNVRKC